MKTLAGLLLLAALLNGCVALVAGGIGAGAVAFTRGELGSSYDEPYDRTWQAALDVLGEMGISIYNTNKDGGLIEGTKKDGTNVRLAIESLTPKTTKVRIRVGKLGNEEESQQIDRNIRRHLNVKQPESNEQAKRSELGQP